VLPLLAVALGAFAIGIEGLMLAGLLAAISADVGVRIAVAAQLVTVFSLAFALGSPRKAPHTHMDNDEPLMNASRSALIVSACVVGIPCGKPL
jgi:predicted MFS family arabinose efflux permease